MNVHFKRKHTMFWIKNEIDRIGTVVKLMTSTGKRARKYLTSFANWSKGGKGKQILHQNDYANWSKGGLHFAPSPNARLKFKVKGLLQ
eukprot:scaffold37966_cov65-Cyclotella_meneghiniana.AAC.1